MNETVIESLICWSFEFSRHATEVGINTLLTSTVLIAIGMLVARVCRPHGPALTSAIYRSTLVAICVAGLVVLIPIPNPFGSWAIDLPDATTSQRIQISANENRSSTDQSRVVRSTPTLTPTAVDPAYASDASLAQVAQFDSISQSLPSNENQPNADTRNPGLVGNPQSGQAFAGGERITFAGKLYTGFVMLWLGGAVWRLTRVGVGWRRIMDIRSGALSATESESAYCQHIAEQMGVEKPQLLRSPQISSPCLVGLTAPAILLPAQMANAKSIQRAIAHEMAHLVRRDNFWNWVQQAVHAVLWFQPLMKSLILRIETVAEEVCDDAVIRLGFDRTRYAQQLLDLADRQTAEAMLLEVGMLNHSSALRGRIARIIDTERTLTDEMTTRAAAVIFASACIAAIAIGSLGSATLFGNGLNREKPAPSSEFVDQTNSTANSQKTGSAPTSKTIAGSVWTEQGQPISGARVQFVLLDDWPDFNRRVVAETKTDPAGRYTFDVASATLQDVIAKRVTGYVLVLADGFAGQQRNWLDQPKSNTDLTPKSARLNFTLYPHQLIRGQVADSAGRPVNGAVVETVWAKRLPAEVATKWLAKLGETKSRYDADDLISVPNDNESHWSVGTHQRNVTTNERGEFEIKDIAGDAKLELQISHPRFITTGLTLLNRRMKDDDSHPEHPLFGNRPTITLKPCRPIKGTIVDAQTGKPIPNAIIRSLKFGAPQMQIAWGVVAEAKTDTNGRFELLGMPNSDQSRIAVFLAKEAGSEIAYLPQTIRNMPKTENAKPVERTIRMDRGIWISGRVVDPSIGQGISANVVYTPLKSNPTLKNIRAFSRKDRLHQFQFMDGFRSDRQGNFRIPGLPGPGVLAAYTHDGSFRRSAGLEKIKEKFGVGLPAERIEILKQSGIDASKWKTIPTQLSLSHRELGQSSSYVAIDAEPKRDFTQNIELDPGQTVRIKVIASTGEPVEKFIVYGYRDTWDKKEFDNGIATIERVGRDESKPIFIESKSQQLAIATKISFKPDSEFQTITLAPYCKVKGRLADPDGNPLKGHWVEIESKKVQADDDGRFVIDTIAVGRFSPGTLEVQIYNPQETTTAGTLLKATLQPGKTVDLDDLIFDSDRLVKFSSGVIGD